MAMLRMPWSLLGRIVRLGRHRVDPISQSVGPEVLIQESSARSSADRLLGVRLGLGYADLREQRNLDTERSLRLLDDPCHPHAWPARLVEDEARAEPHVGLVLEVLELLVRERDPVAVHAASLRRCPVGIQAPRRLSGASTGKSQKLDSAPNLGFDTLHDRVTRL